MPIVPPVGTLTSGRSLQFAFNDTTDNPLPATWSLNPAGVGAIDASGLYTAPTQVAQPIFLTIAATTAGANPQTATATLQLVPPEVLLTPCKVDLRQGGAVQQFDAKVPGDSTNEVQWNIAPTLGTMQNGRYTAPPEILDDCDILVTATSAVEPHKFGTATVRLHAKPLASQWVILLFVYLLSVYSLVTLFIGLWPPSLPDSVVVEKSRVARSVADEAVTKAQADEKSASDALAEAQKQQKAGPGDAASKKVDDAQSALTKATDALNKAKATAKAALDCLKDLEEPPVPVRLPFLKDCAIPHEVDLILLVLITGALGSFVHITRSFIDFVGNKAIRGSWSFWYLLNPLIGSALALIFYLAVRAGFLTPATSGANLNTYGLVAISGMVGLFTKRATSKLDEVFATLFKTQKDDQELKNPLKDDPKGKPPLDKPKS